MTPADVTQLLLSWQHGDADALERLLPVVYDHLHRLAHARLRGECAGQAFQTTSLVNETYLRLVDGTRVQWRNRAHFFALCARLMRRILIDRARLTVEEASAVVGISPETVRRDFNVAKLWLRHELRSATTEARP